MDLKSFIDSEPLNADRTNEAVYAWAVEPVSTLSHITQGQLLGWTVSVDAITRLEAAMLVAETRAIAKAAMRVVDRTTGLDLADTSAQQMLAAMVSLSMFTQGEIDALNAIGTVQMPRWRGAGVNKPILGDIIAARRV